MGKKRKEEEDKEVVECTEEREKGPQNYLYIRKPFEIEKDRHTALAVSVKSPTGLLILVGKRSANECFCMEGLWGTIKDPSKHSRQAQALPLHLREKTEAKNDLPLRNGQS